MSSKAQLRGHFARLRDELGPNERGRASHQIRHQVLGLPELRSAQTVFCYVSLGGEVDTRELIDQLIESGRTVAVPHIDDQGAMRACIVESRDELAPGRFGIPAPAGESVLKRTPELTICPALAFTRLGIRLGQGGGFYDRYLELHPRTRRVGLAFDAQLADHLPAMAHDQPMDLVVTQTQVYRR